MNRTSLSILLSALLVLPGCSSFSTDINDLLRPPQLTAEQSEIHNALDSVIGSGRTIQLKYPKRGDYLSAFVMYDLDDDGQDEALVFYEDANTEYGTRINILDNGESGWHSVLDYPGNGSTVDQIRFVEVSGREGCDILIGWEYSNQELRTVDLYHYRDHTLESLFSNTYSELVVADLDGKGYDDIIMLEANASARPVDAKMATLLEDGTVGTVGVEYRMTNSFIAYEQVVSGMTADGLTAVYADGWLDSETLCTDVLYYNEDLGGLTSLLLYDMDDYTERTVRNLEITTRDIDYDGIPEIPMPEPLPGYETFSAEDAMFLVNYSAVDSEGILRYTAAAINLDAGYMVKFPVKWRDKVTITKQDKSNEWFFWVFDGSLSQMRDELLRIKFYSTRDYHDQFDTETYQIIGTKGNFEYFAYIPENSGDDYGITYEQLEKMFSLL